MICDPLSAFRRQLIAVIAVAIPGANKFGVGANALPESLMHEPIRILQMRGPNGHVLIQVATAILLIADYFSSDRDGSCRGNHRRDQ